MLSITPFNFTLAFYHHISPPPLRPRTCCAHLETFSKIYLVIVTARPPLPSPFPLYLCVAYLYLFPFVWPRPTRQSYINHSSPRFTSFLCLVRPTARRQIELLYHHVHLPALRPPFSVSTVCPHARVAVGHLSVARPPPPSRRSHHFRVSLASSLPVASSLLTSYHRFATAHTHTHTPASRLRFPSGSQTRLRSRTTLELTAVWTFHLCYTVTTKWITLFLTVSKCYLTTSQWPRPCVGIACHACIMFSSPERIRVRG